MLLIKYFKRALTRDELMELLNWFKKPLNWWLGLLLVINGTWLVRGVEGWESAVPVGATSIIVGLVMVVFLGKIKEK